MRTDDTCPTLQEVLAQLVRQGLLDEASVTRIWQYLAHRQTATNEPLLVKLLMALGAWVAAICFVACLGIAGLIHDDWWRLGGWGVVCLVIATVLRRTTDHIFPAQLALALSSAGHGLTLAGAADLVSFQATVAAVTATAILLCVVLYPLYTDSLHRLLSCLLAMGCLTAWIMQSRLWPLIHVDLLAKIMAIGFVFVYRADVLVLRPLGYAAAISIPASLLTLTTLLEQDQLTITWWPANVMFAAALIWLYQWVAGGWARLRAEPLVIAVAATVVLASFTTPGILAAVALMVLGYARDDRYLWGLGALFFPMFMVSFYYEWQTTLFVKSWIMAGSGAVLLTARWILGMRSWAEE